MKKLYSLILLLVLTSIHASGQFVTRWKTDNDGVSNSNQIIIPATGMDYNITWQEEGNPTNNGSETGNGFHTLTFPSPGTYQVSIEPGSGTFSRIAFASGNDPNKLLEIRQWGNIRWESMARAFQGCEQLQVTATDVPDLQDVTSMEAMFSMCKALTGTAEMNNWDVSRVTDMGSVFSYASAFNAPISGWNVSNVTNMGAMFQGAAAFDQPIGGWDVSNVTNMSNMFMEAANFNQALDSWNVAQVTNMNSMFNSVNAFNQPIGSWNVGNVTDMFMMFYGAGAFDQPIGSWDVKHVTDMSYMFFYAVNFNQPLNDWNVSKVINMSSVFYGAAAFNRPLGNWNLGSATDLSYFASYSAMSCISMTATLQGWAANPATPDNLTFQAEQVSYGYEAADALNVLRNTKNWTIELGEEIDCNPASATYITIWEVGEEEAPDYSITIPATGTNYEISWEDVDNSANSGTAIASNTFKLNFPSAGRYKVTISPGSGTFERIRFANSGDRLKLREIQQWGAIQWSDMSEAYSGCSNLVITATDSPDMESVTSTAAMFKNCSALSEVPGMANWNVSEVTDMSEMFRSASKFNEDIAFWDVSSVTTMRSMFQSAVQFNFSLDYWDLEEATDLTDMLTATGMDCLSMTVTLEGWASKSWTANNVTFSATDRTYGKRGTIALETLANEKNWTIQAGSEVECSALAVSLIGFDAKNENGVVRLEWATATETDNDYFEIERSADARNWEALTRIGGAGTVNTTRHYRESDVNPLQGNSYYRLKIVDAAGKADYSNIVAVRIANAFAQSIYPNPATTAVTLSGKVDGQLSIFNLSGMEVFQMQVKSEKSKISIRHLPAGTYLIKTEDGWNTTLIKQ